MDGWGHEGKELIGAMACSANDPESDSHHEHRQTTAKHQIKDSFT
jgi:hypothetical protein